MSKKQDLINNVKESVNALSQLIVAIIEDNTEKYINAQAKIAYLEAQFENIAGKELDAKFDNFLDSIAGCSPSDMENIVAREDEQGFFSCVGKMEYYSIQFINDNVA